jgi:DNA polymerase III alpha subunit (gram-positive type)
MKLLWVDVETTGLDSSKDELLELAIVPANFEEPFAIDTCANCGDARRPARVRSEEGA